MMIPKYEISGRNVLKDGHMVIADGRTSPFYVLESDINQNINTEDVVK